MLEITVNMMGRTMTIHPTLLFDEEHALLVDVGVPGQLGIIKTAVEAAGVPFDKIDTVILTHQDIDHIGGIKDLLAAVDGPVQIYAHAEDQPYIEGDQPPIKMSPERVKQMLANLPPEVRAQVEPTLLHPPTAKVTSAVSDDQVLPLFGGLRVVFTPGHTPGHISLYHEPSKTLITGDAVVSDGGKVLGPNPQATPDMPLALASMKKFTGLDIDRAICYHGGLCDADVNGQFRALTE